MPEQYSLVRHAWLPVALEDGRWVFVRPRDIASKFDGRAIVRIATGRPDSDISLTEFLIGLLAVTMGPKDQREWLKRYREPPKPEDFEAAFRPFEAAMILDGDGPRFLQDLEQLEGEPNPIEGLFIDAPGGNTLKENADHFVKRGRSSALSRAGAALALITLQTSAPSGGAGHRTSLRGGGPLTTLVVPGTSDNREPTLWQRLWANVPKDFSAGTNDGVRVFPWLVATRVSDKSGVSTTPDDVHPAQAFFGMPRRVRLIFEPNSEKRPCDLLGVVDDVVVTGYVTRPWGTNYTSWSRGHPLSPYYKQKETDPEFLPLHIKSSRVGYRQWLGMVMEAQEDRRVPAKCLTDFRDRAQNLAKAEQHGARLLVAGYAMDNMKPLDFGEALLPLIITGDPACDQEVKKLAHDWVTAADSVASQLVSSVKRALFGEKATAERDSTILEPVKSRFWADTEQDFYDELRKAADRIEAHKGKLDDHHDRLKAEAGAEWLKSLKRHALRIFDDAVPIENAESHKIEDVIAGRRMLGIMLSGFGKGGGQLFTLLSQPPVETKSKNGRKAA